MFLVHEPSSLWPECWMPLIMTNTKLNLAAPWPEVREKIKEINVELTDEDLAYGPGKEDELLDHLSRKMHRHPEDVKSWIESISANRGKAS
jgi:hypothetical protein